MNPLGGYTNFDVLVPFLASKSKWLDSIPFKQDLLQFLDSQHSGNGFGMIKKDTDLAIKDQIYQKIKKNQFYQNM